jgi:hypothetical protein
MVNHTNNKNTNGNILESNSTDQYLQNLNSYIQEKRTTRNSEEIWFNNIPVLFDPAYVFEIIPTNSMTFGEKINAITRFALFLAILLVILKSNHIYLYVFIVPVIITYIIYIFSPNSKEYFNTNRNRNNENNINVLSTDDELTTVMENALSECQPPTDDNPLMNILPTDNFQNRKPACNVLNQDIAAQVSDKISDTYVERLYADSTHTINRNIGERDFYTMPNSRVPNDQGSFAKWLYETPVACVTGGVGELKQHRSCAYNNKTLNELKTDYEKIPNEVPTLTF